MRTTVKEGGGLIAVIGHHCVMPLDSLHTRFHKSETLGLCHCKSCPFSEGSSWNPGQGGTCEKCGELSPELVTHNLLR